MSKLFISHATADRQFVEHDLIGLLNALGFETWIAEETIQTAEHWERAILSGLEESKWFVLVMSPASAVSEWVKDEVNWAIEKRPGGIIPILIADCNPRDFHIRLPRIQVVDYLRDSRKAVQTLIKRLVDAEYRSVRLGIKALIESAEIPMVFTDRNLVIEFFNRPYASILDASGPIDGQHLSKMIDHLVRLAPPERQAGLRKRQELLVNKITRDLTGHSEECEIIDHRKLAGNRYQGLNKVWISGDKVYVPGDDEPVGMFAVFHVESITDPEILRRYPEAEW